MTKDDPFFFKGTSLNANDDDVHTWVVIELPSIECDAHEDEDGISVQI